MCLMSTKTKVYLRQDIHIYVYQSGSPHHHDENRADYKLNLANTSSFPLQSTSTLAIPKK
jgi:hypothetical protein